VSAALKIDTDAS